MSTRVTIVLDDENNRWLRKLQAKRIQQLGKSVSMSRLINEMLLEMKQ